MQQKAIAIVRMNCTYQSLNWFMKKKYIVEIRD